MGSSPFARRYLGNRFFFLFLGVLRCFSSPGFLLAAYLFSDGYLNITSGEFPHSDILGLSVVCTYPRLIAACHVLLRLLVPRHSPYALIYLTKSLHRELLRFALFFFYHEIKILDFIPCYIVQFSRYTIINSQLIMYNCQLIFHRPYILDLTSKY